MIRAAVEEITMKRETNIIAFPAPRAQVTGEHRLEFDGATPCVIQLSSHRPAARRRSATPASEQTLHELTIGDIWDALNEDRLVMHYQPQYDMSTRQTVAAEALVRIVDRDGQIVGPNRFIELAEQSDLIIPFGRAVIERVCADLAGLRAAGGSIRRVSINLCANQVNSDASLPDFVDDMLECYGLERGDLEFELTERQHLGPFSDGLEVLRELADRGARIVIDDFGIGYSSMMYLNELPVSAFKLDRALVDRLPEDTGTQAIVASLLTLAENLNLEVVAEGIETDAQHFYLAAAGCRFAQGFGYARPMAMTDLETFLRERARSGYVAERPGV